MTSGGGVGGGGAAARVSIPNSTRKMIQNIKEIAGNHSDEEVYAMLRECNMDPNETTQKMLLQDTFHEVKRKRDRRKENASNKEQVDSNWRSGVHGRGSRGGRGSYSSRYLSHDGAKNSLPLKESAANQGSDKGAKTSTIPTSENKLTSFASGSASIITNGPSKQAHAIPPGGTSPMSGSGINFSGEKITAEPWEIKGTTPSEYNTKSGKEDVSVDHDQYFPDTVKPSPALTVAVAKKHQTGSQTAVTNPVDDRVMSVDIDTSSVRSEKRTAEDISSYTHGRLPDKHHGREVVNHIAEEFHARPSSSGTSTFGSRPPSNYSNRSQQIPQKVGPVKEWKPKQMNTNVAQTSGTVEPSGVTATAPDALSIENATSILHKKLEELQFSDGQHVIFPSHIQIPESERTVLSFGSFTTSFGPSSTFDNGPVTEKSFTSLSESSQDIEENAEETSSSVENLSPMVQKDDYSVHPQSPNITTVNQTVDEASYSISDASAAQEHAQSQHENTLSPEDHKTSSVRTVPVYSTLGLIPPMTESPFTNLESSESQARDSSRVPGFVVQQPFDPSTSYYTQVYRPGADSDGRYSQFLASGAATKYSGSLSSQADQSSLESVNSLVQATSVSAAASQAAGVLQNSISVTQQPVPVFRQPAGVHISHYPPNFIPYGPYFSPFYVQPSSIHPFISNAAFPQQHPSGTIYPPVAAATAPVKFPFSQFKAGTNNCISNNAGLTAGYGPYTSTQSGYSPTPVTRTINSASNEDHTGTQYKENTVYLAGHQSEGSTVWIPAPARDVSNLQASSYYSLPQGQHVQFTPSQAGHGAFPGIFHPTQMGSATVHPLLQQSQTVAGAVEMVGPQGGIYPPPPQRPPVNWGNNF